MDGEDIHALALAVDGSGRAVFAWEKGAQLTLAEEVSAGDLRLSQGPSIPGRPHLIDVAAGPQGEAVVMWRQAGFLGQSDDDGAIFLSRRPPGGAFQHDATPVSVGNDAYGPRAAIGPSGDILLVFNQWTGEHYAVAWANPSGLEDVPSFATSQSEALSPPTYFSNSPMPAVGADGSLLVSWYQSPGGPLMTYVSERLGRKGALSHPAADDFLSAPGGPIDSHPIANPRPRVHDDGQAAVVWTQEDGEGHVSAFLATRDAAGVWYPPKDLHDTLDAREGYARCIVLTFDRDGALFIAWERDATIEAAVRLADGTWRTPRGVPEMLSTPGARALDPALAAGRDGGVVLVYREAEPGQPYRVKARRWDRARAAFGDTEAISPEVDEDAQAPLIAMGGPDDRAVVAWPSGDSAGAHQRVRFVTLEP